MWASSPCGYERIWSNTRITLHKCGEQKSMCASTCVYVILCAMQPLCGWLTGEFHEWIGAMVSSPFMYIPLKWKSALCCFHPTMHSIFHPSRSGWWCSLFCETTAELSLTLRTGFAITGWIASTWSAFGECVITQCFKKTFFALLMISNFHYKY